MCLGSFAAALTLAASAAADDAAPLERRVKDLEAEVKKLQAAQSSTEGVVRTATKASVALSGYVETSYQWNFNEPDNLITNYRAFDDRHATFLVQNVVLDALASYDRVSAHLAVQFGETGQTYYAGEPVWKATSGAGASGPDVWKLIQQATLGWKAPVGRGLLLEAGLFLSPIGPESMAIKDQWNWSRSNLFFALPYYHAGARASYPLTDRLTAQAMVCNGWNDAVDGNLHASIEGNLTYTVPDRLTVQALYFGGVERPEGAPEGSPWRNLFDAYLVYSPTKWFSTMFHADAGFEPNDFGNSGWAAGAVYLRVQPAKWLYLAARADAFYEWIASDATGASTPLFWEGSHWVSSQTATVDVRPTDNISVRLEFRHDQSELPIYFQGRVATDASGNFLPNAMTQDTLTLGATAWF
ncbi:MAG TPA: outer membrane beta-barrel protein [Polyangiaceae bacterium]